MLLRLLLEENIDEAEHNVCIILEQVRRGKKTHFHTRGLDYRNLSVGKAENAK